MYIKSWQTYNIISLPLQGAISNVINNYNDFFIIYLVCQLRELVVIKRC